MQLTLEDEFGDIVQKARQGHGLTMEELAGRSSLSPARLRQLEAYEEPTREEVSVLAEVLDLKSDALLDIALERWDPENEKLADPGETVGLTRITYEPWRVNCYLVADRESDLCIVVDPGAEPATIVEAVTGRGYTAVAVLLTHGHGDHAGAAAEVSDSLGCPVYIHPGDRTMVVDGGVREVRSLPADNVFELEPFRIEVVHVPGHTPGSVVYRIGSVQFSGDCLFAGSIGRVNLGPDTYQEALHSIRQEVLSAPKNTLILPGHGIATSVGQELVHNPFFG